MSYLPDINAMIEKAEKEGIEQYIRFTYERAGEEVSHIQGTLTNIGEGENEKTVIDVKAAGFPNISFYKEINDKDLPAEVRKNNFMRKLVEGFSGLYVRPEFVRL